MPESRDGILGPGLFIDKEAVFMTDELPSKKRTMSRYRSPDAMQKAWDEFMVEHKDLLRELASG